MNNPPSQLPFSLRVQELCDRENLSLYELAKRAGLTQSTLLSAVHRQKGNPSLSTIQRICEGFDITLREFFSSELFDRY